MVIVELSKDEWYTMLDALSALRRQDLEDTVRVAAVRGRLEVARQLAMSDGCW
jgi:hypothetical protein